MTKPKWNPSSWKGKNADQQPDYSDSDQVASVIKHLSKFPPIVTSWEIEALKQHIARAQNGEAFVL
ncbi:uncharacterized protein METZ01_LOCUS113191 [marine metagenome]|uniref:3-deoxy-7-phosphoheptulonate synthase n=1 Tax=marine metagenome TaxID=408172 RepID=A0A381X839_9ZZZZ